MHCFEFAPLGTLSTRKASLAQNGFAGTENLGQVTILWHFNSRLLESRQSKICATNYRISGELGIRCEKDVAILFNASVIAGLLNTYVEYGLNLLNKEDKCPNSAISFPTTIHVPLT